MTGLLFATVSQCVIFTASSSTALAANPAVMIPTAPLISPASALAYYGTPASPTPPSTRDPLVAEAARSLRYDVDTIYAFVRDNVRLTPVFGLQKGARGVVLDGYGSAFDQAQFMVDTLREADAVASKGYNPVYKLGSISLTNSPPGPGSATRRSLPNFLPMGASLRPSRAADHPLPCRCCIYGCR
tara:strand:- start:6570 stop:7127 length:558 start_codon:yes stop_codon:yes gene_type:complete